MWSDRYPPAAVDPHDWEAVRNGLHSMGKRLGGPKGSVGNLAFRASLALNLMQHRYKSDLSVVGNQGRLFVERALGVFIPAAALAAGARAQPRVCGLLCTPSRYRTQRVAGRVTNTAPPTCARHALALALALTPVRGAGASLFFLSPMHADHLQGLHHGWRAVTTPT